ncbi:MAG TPA: tetratricopeptide repeat protein [Terriglobales bacterium]|nr:tetratricopeptide repeat protein [Terriglobales bacterium]
MLFLRDKLFLAVFLVILVVAPSWSQIGGVQDPGLASSTQLPGSSPQNGPDLKRAGTGMIVGSVRTLDDKPVANARVEISSLAAGQRMMTAYTSADGSFMVAGLSTGDYDVRAESGVLETSARVQVGDGQTWLNMRVPNSATQERGGSGPTVSVQQLRVPEKAASFLAKAHQAMDKRKLDDAANYVSKALASYPEYAQALTLRAVLEMQQDKYDQAAADANHAIQDDPNYGTGYLVIGAVLNCQKKFEDALRSLGRAETLMPNAWQGYFESSKALLQLERFQPALQQADKALTLPDAGPHPELHLIKGYAYIGLRTYGAAVTELEQYISHFPDGPDAARVRSDLEKIRPLAAASVAR